MNKKNFILLFLIFIVGFSIRIFKIDTVPASLNWDEVSHGYNAYSILKTGSDEWGFKLPIIFRAYGDYKLPVYIYSVVPFVAFFGLNEFSVRIVSVIAGSLAIILVYFLILNLLSRNKQKQQIALISSLLVAVEPWSFFLSRGAFEANLAFFIFLLAVTCFSIFIEKHKIIFFLLANLFFGLTLWTYNSYRVFTPLVVFYLYFIYRNHISKFRKKTFWGILVFGLFMLPMLNQMMFGSGRERLKLVSILDDGAVNRIIENRNNSKLPSLLTKILYNRPLYFSSHFIKNYISFYSPEFLFVKGGSHYQFNTPFYGLLYLVNLPFFILGLLYLIKNFKLKSFKIMFIWILFYPLAASVTRESPHTLRGITFLPIPMVLTAIGLVNSYETIKKIRFRNLSPNIYAFSYFFILGISVFIYYKFYFSSYVKYYSWAWQFGYKDTVSYIKDNYFEYDYILISKVYGEPHEFVLFYYSWEPKKYFEDSNLKRFYQSSWYWVDSFDKFYFINDWNINIDSLGTKKFKLESGGEIDCSSKRCLLITKPDIWFSVWKIRKVIKYPTGEEAAFLIYDNL